MTPIQSREEVAKFYRFRNSGSASGSITSAGTVTLDGSE